MIIFKQSQQNCTEIKNQLIVEIEYFKIFSDATEYCSCKSLIKRELYCQHFRKIDTSVKRYVFTYCNQCSLHILVLQPSIELKLIRQPTVQLYPLTSLEIGNYNNSLVCYLRHQQAGVKRPHVMLLNVSKNF